MVRRAPTNERYRKDAKIGSTRRSAASAKPKRHLGESSAQSSAPKGRKSAKPARKRSPLLMPNPDTPEFRRWNAINFAFLGVALAFAIIGVTTSRVLAATPWPSVVFGGEFAALGASLYIQLVKLRGMRREWVASGKAEEQAKADEKARAERDAAKAAAKAAAAKASAKDGSKTG